MSDQQKRLDEIRRLVASRVEEEAADMVAGEGHESAQGGINGEEVDIGFVNKCYQTWTLGDSMLFNYLNKGKFLFNESSEQWLSFRSPHWEVEKSKTGPLVAVEKVVDQYIRLLHEVNERIDRLDMSDKDDKAQLKGLLKTRTGILSRFDTLRGKAGRLNVLHFSYTNTDPLITDHLALDQHPMLLPCNNGVYDLRLRMFRAGSPDDLLTVAAPADYLDRDEPCPRWEQFLVEILGDKPDVIHYLQKILGYAITGLRSEHLFVVLHGPHGRNGKNTMINVLSAVLGKMVSKIPTELLMFQKFGKSSNAPTPEVMDIKGKRIIWASETEKGHSFAAGRVKEFSGGEPLKGRGLQDRDMTEFDPTHVLFLLCNDLPKAPPMDNAFWSRIRVFTLPYSFLDRPTEDHHRPVDKHLEQDLIEEAPGILSWLIRGNELWQDEGLGDVPQQVYDDSIKYREHEDDLQEFIEAKCTVDKADVSKENRENASTLYKTYRDWWEEHNTTKAMNQKAFSDQIQAKGFTRIKSDRVYYQFIKLVTWLGESE